MFIRAARAQAGGNGGGTPFRLPINGRSISVLGPDARAVDPDGGPAPADHGGAGAGPRHPSPVEARRAGRYWGDRRRDQRAKCRQSRRRRRTAHRASGWDTRRRIDAGRRRGPRPNDRLGRRAADRNADRIPRRARDRLGRRTVDRTGRVRREWLRGELLEEARVRAAAGRLVQMNVRGNGGALASLDRRHARVRMRCAAGGAVVARPLCRCRRRGNHHAGKGDPDGACRSRAHGSPCGSLAAAECAAASGV